MPTFVRVGAAFVRDEFVVREEFVLSFVVVVVIFIFVIVIVSFERVSD